MQAEIVRLGSIGGLDRSPHGNGTVDFRARRCWSDHGMVFLDCSVIVELSWQRPNGNVGGYRRPNCVMRKVSEATS